MSQIDVSVICTFHDEEYLVGATLGSLLQSIEKARQNGCEVEVILALDKPTAATERLVKHHSANISCRVLEFNLGDQGLVRNHSVIVAKGKFIAFLDGDDLIGYDWLWRGFEELCNTGGIVHPEFNIFFEGRGSIFVHKPSDDLLFDMDYIRVGNYWDAMCMCESQILRDYPYRERDIELGFAYEDWDWNMRTLADGIEHRVVRDTLHFKRARRMSQSKKSRDRGVVFHTNDLSYYSCSKYRSASTELLVD